MSTKEIIKSIEKLPFNDKLLVIEKTLKALHEPKNFSLGKAATALLNDYKKDKSLIAFTAIDSEKFHEA